MIPTRSFIFLVLLLGPPAASGQTITSGVLGGLNITDMVTTPDAEFAVERRNRADVGGFIRLPVTPLFDFEARVLYLQTGVDLGASPEIGGFTSGRVDVDYVAVPALVRYRIGNGTVQPYIVGGAELAVKTNAALRLIAQGTLFEDEDFDDDVRSNNVSLDIGGGIEFPADRLFVIVEGMYSHGIRNIIDAEDDDFDSVKTRAFRVSVGLRF